MKLKFEATWVLYANQGNQNFPARFFWIDLWSFYTKIDFDLSKNQLRPT